MWRLKLFIAFAVIAAAVPADAAEDLPFEAYVVPSEAAVYSGPAEPRYVTHEIPRGTKVEVYERRDEWLGIRPPEGSFSWVPAAAMKMSQEPGVAEADGSGVAAWIGSSAERVSEHQSSVQLEQGERVEVLGKKEVETAGGQRETWLKIAPPAGEFRWIHASQVSREAPAAFIATPAVARDNEQWSSRPLGRRRGAEAERESHTAAAEEQPARDRGPFRRTSMELRDLRPAVRAASFQRQRGDDVVQQAAHEDALTEPSASSRPLSPDGFVPRQARPGQARLQARAPTLPLSPSPLPIERGRVGERERGGIEHTPAATDGDAGVQRRLQEIDLSLSLMISGDRSQWNLAALKREVAQLIENGATPVDRGEARFMLEKIERFAEAFGVEDDDGSPDLPVGSVAARKAALAAATAPQYDGTGYLTPVRAARPVAPYALLDQSGNRLCYVTPVPGFNLRAYENRRIGVFGKRGYMASAGASHLLAERVVDLDKQMR
ncbi:MAG TPA: hypothetical protein VMP01_10105 [Pirellulaceae bacterium]|nr:hypothetical protein [Pirellulaceae bacterium]